MRTSLPSGIGSCVSAMEYDERRLEHATGELSNAQTDGFKSAVDAAGRRQSALRPTGRPLDLAISGESGAIRLAPRTQHGVAAERAVSVRDASLHRDNQGYLVDDRGRALLGTGGPVVVAEGAQFRTDGSVVVDGSTVAHVPLAAGSELRSGFVAGSNVNSISTMVEILDAQRSFETAQKSLSALDATRSKATNDVGHLQ